MRVTGRVAQVKSVMAGFGESVGGASGPRSRSWSHRCCRPAATSSSP